MPEQELLWGIVLLVAALGLLLLEVFVPSMGLLSTVAIALAIAGVVLLFRYDPITGAIGLVAVLVLGPMIVVFGLKVFPHTPIGRAILFGGKTQEQIEHETAQKQAQFDERLALVGMEGVALTVLRPVGTIRIEGTRYDALSELGMIQPGTRVRVTALDGTQLRVREIT